MAVDKNLFMYNLAVVSIMKNEGPYAKEWLDYHLLAGVDHFYLYDNDSPDNLKEVLQPYIDAGIVTYTFYPGKARQNEAYNDAKQNYRFFCRYMAVIDADEFIFPRNSNRNIVEVLDEILADKPQAVAVGADWYMFGSNYHEIADYSRGVLNRFTRREGNANKHIKTIANPRKIDHFCNPHYAMYFEGHYCINENGEPIPGPFNENCTAEKISINHYFTKSREEYILKANRGTADNALARKPESFEHNNNDIFDESILKYRDEKLSALTADGRNLMEIFASSKRVDFNRIFGALIQNLSPTLSRNSNQDLFQGKMETFLTCRAISTFMRENVLDESAGRFLEEMSLKAIYRTLFTSMNIADMKLLIAELPKILPLKYPAMEDIRKALIEMIPQLMNFYRVYDPYAWKEFVNLRYLTEILKLM